jgi:hypothetical protein
MDDLRSKLNKLDVVAHICNTSTREDEEDDKFEARATQRLSKKGGRGRKEPSYIARKGMWQCSFH